jgi:hypothetical protein
MSRKSNNFFIEGLITAIFIHYLVMGFFDIVYSINNLITWLKSVGVIR